MTSNKNIKLIIYNGGCYGTFVHWALNYFSGKTELLPFKKDGSSHLFAGHQFYSMNEFRNFCDSDTILDSARIHPKFQELESAHDNILEFANLSDRAVLLYADYDSIIFNINNKFEKIWEYGWLEHNGTLIKDNLAKWSDKTLDVMDRWELREFLSFFIYKQHLAESELENVLTLDHENLLKINIKELFENFNSTFKRILDFCDYPETRTNYKEIYDIWTPLQIHRHKDKLVSDIVESVVNNTTFDWSDQKLTIVDEAFIQMRLRDLYKLELLCYNLNVFPTNKADLKKLLINV
jgi:hypothetical protein